MSWLNSSLNSIKGQLSNLAQEVLADSPNQGDGLEVETAGTLEILGETQRQCEQLNQICVEKDNEIANLQKQIEELQNKLDEGGNNRSSKSPIKKNDSLEDSWYWEPDNNAAAATTTTTSPELSTKNENDHTSESSSGPEIVDIPLEDVQMAVGSTKNKRNRLPLPDHRLKKENIELQRKIRELEDEKRQLNASLDELDNQHNVAVQNILELKTDLQEKLTSITKEYDTLKNDSEVKLKDNENIIKSVQKELEMLQNTHHSVVNENSKLKEDVGVCVENLNATKEELNSLISLLEKKDKDNAELIERIKESNSMIDEATEERTMLQQKLETITKEFDAMKLLQNSSEEKKFSESSSGKQSVDDEFIVVSGGEGGSSSATTPPTKEELKDKIVSLESRVSELTLENSSHALKLQNIEIEHELTVSPLKKNLEEMQEKCSSYDEKLQQFIDEERKYKEKLLKYDSEKIELMNAVEKAEKEAQMLRQEIETASISMENVSELQSKLLALSQENDQIKAKLEIAVEQNSKIAEIMEENEKYKKELEDLEQVVAKKKLTEKELHESSAKLFELESCITILNEENETLRKETEVLFESKRNASEIQMKLVEENDVLLKKLNELETTVSVTEDKEEIKESSAIPISDLRKLISTYANVEIQSNNTSETVEDAFKKIRDKLWKIEVLEKKLTQMSEEISDLQDSKLVWDHEKKTLEADISQYVVQCDELMKNNEILLNELENHKRNKLETIPENNEENLIVLETQLEECTNLNRTLEEEYGELKSRIIELEVEKQENAKQSKSYQDELIELTKKLQDMQLQVETLELEKSNLIFEMNELRIDDKSNEYKELHTEFHVNLDKVSNLENQLERLSKDHADLVSAMQSQKLALVEANKENAELKVNFEKASEELKMVKSEILQKSIQNENAASESHEQHLSRIKKLESDLLATTTDLNKQIASLEFEKNEIVKALQAKHSENMQYYMEIKRLSQLLQQQQEQQEQQQHSIDEQLKKPCENCSILNEKIEELNKQIEKMTDQVNFLKEKSDILTTNLLTEQTNQKLLHQEKMEMAEQNANLQKDLERLREHLLEVEETHTKETIEMQKQLDETNAVMVELRDEVSKSSNAYTSASIRANQHAETLQMQYILVTQQRDELLSKLSLAEDRESKNQAALCNLQCALEQFQNDKEKDIQVATQRIRKELNEEINNQTKLRTEISALNQQLAEAKQGLLAASRLSDQLESSQQSIAALREEIESLKKEKVTLEEKLYCSVSSQTDKIEKNLIKSLLIGYIVSENINDKNQVLRMISSVLDFTQIESDRVGLQKQQNSATGGWFGSLIGSSTAGTIGTQTKDNLVQAFVQFLEQESQPRTNSDNMPNLLNMPSTRKISTSSGRQYGGGISQANATETPTETTVGSSRTVQPILLSSNIIDDFTPSRNSSSILKDILSDS